MNTIPDKVAELSTLLQLYLKQEFPDGGWFAADQETVHFFRKMIQAKKKPAEQHAQKTVPLPAPASPKQEKSDDRNPEITLTPAQSPLPPATEKKDVKPAPKKTAAEREKFHLEPFQTSAASDFQEIRVIFSEKYPKIPILDYVPDVKTIAPQVAIFYEAALPEELLFLKNLAQSVTISLGKAELFKISLLSKESFKNRLTSQNQLKLMIAPYSVNLPFAVPLVKFLDIQDYLRDPLKKEALWEEIKKAI